MSCYNPLKVPVRELFWGRLHDVQMDITYSYALGKGDRSLGALLILRMDDQVIEFHKLSIEVHSREESDALGISVPASYTPECRNDSIRLELKVKHYEPAIVSRFTDTQDSLGRYRRKLLKWISGDPKGIKFYSSADISLESGETINTIHEVLMISEYVKFQ